MSAAEKGLVPVAIATLLCAAVASAEPPSGSGPLLKARVAPEEFGIQDETVTVVSAASFAAIKIDSGALDVGTPIDLRTFGRFCNDCSEEGVEYFATLTIPAGAVVDFIGLNSQSDVDEVLDFALIERNRAGHVAGLVGFSIPAHSWDTDYDGPLNVAIPNNLDHHYVLLVEQAPSPRPQFFGAVEIWWHRRVSDPPAAATFGDVPVTHPFFQFIEALAASGITGGCGGGNFCPDSPLTRGQMAVFLSKALGLHFPH